MHMAGNVILFVITLVCIASSFAEQVENFQPHNETEFDFHNKTECDCGYNARSCIFDLNGVKHCVCDDEYTVYNGTCVECNCGNHTKSCEIDHQQGTKRCECKDGYVLRQGECVECDCGMKAFSCFYDWRDVKTCVCQSGYIERNGTCIKSCAGSECPEGQECRPNEEGEYMCQCKPNFGGKDCKTNLLCEKLQPMCRDMGAECIIENSEALCRCPWGQIVGIPSGICEDLCNSETCFHGRCEFLTNSKVERNYRCICDAGYTGLRCETKIIDNSGELIRFAILVSMNVILFILISAMFCFLCANKKLILQNGLNANVIQTKKQNFEEFDETLNNNIGSELLTKQANEDEPNQLCEKVEPLCRDMGAECIVENWEAFCRCPWGQTVGLPSGICEDVCNSETCVNGECEFLTNSREKPNYICICDAGYTGLRCEHEIVDNLNKSNLACEKLEPMCRDMGAECIIENSEAICRCPWGQTVGLQSGICEDVCNPVTCFHGECEFLTNSREKPNYRCICDAGYTGLRCENKIVDKSNDSDQLYAPGDRLSDCHLEYVKIFVTDPEVFSFRSQQTKN
ncbi:EGF-like domain-containing protein [Trichonephila clavata]|uniref:EGF-like domain-containing protein n=1 Tax=Trichonephila clavata TaxID=2740835 RepID=A0A8X6F6C3_TRICU|nr:EGF-like domain-containing protein [Trichonephila clavata]